MIQTKSVLSEFMNKQVKLIEAKKYDSLYRLLGSYYGSLLERLPDSDYQLLEDEFQKYKGFKQFIKKLKESKEFYMNYVRPDAFYNEYSHNKVSLKRKVDYTDAY